MVVRDILGVKHIDLMRSAQQLIYLKDKYGELRLETACARAVSFCSLRYSTVKNILKNGVDSNGITELEAFDNLAKTVYGQNAKFYREITELEN